MDPLLTEYTALYKLAFADVSTSLGGTKEAGRLGNAANKVQDFLFPRMKGLSDDAVESVVSATPKRDFFGWTDEAADYAKQIDELKGHQAHAAAQAAAERANTLKRYDVDVDAYDKMMAGGAEAAGGAAKPVAEATGAVAGEAAQSGGHGLRNALLAGTGMAGAGLAGHQYGTMKEEERGRRNRNLAFGAGAAAGIAAPGLVQNLGQTMQGLGGVATGGRRPGPPPPTAPRPQAGRPGGLSPQQAMMMRQRGY